MHIELPAVIGTLEILSIELSTVKRHATVWACVAQGKRMSGTITADDKRKLQQHGFMQLIPMHLVGWHCAIPEAGEHQGIRGLALWEIEFGHEEKLVTVDF